MVRESKLHQGRGALWRIRIYHICNVNESGKVIVRPHRDTDHHQNLIISRGSLLPTPTTFGRHPYMRPWVILLTEWQTDRQTGTEEQTAPNITNELWCSNRHDCWCSQTSWLWLIDGFEPIRLTCTFSIHVQNSVFQCNCSWNLWHQFSSFTTNSNC